MALRGYIGAALASALLAPVCQALADGPKERMERSAERPSPRLEPIAATTIGGSGVEQVAGAGFGREGDVILFFNTWGPDLPRLTDHENTMIFGGRQRSYDRSQRVYIERGTGLHGARLNQENTNVAGVVVRCDPNMTEVKSVFAFDYGIARFGPPGSCKVAPDGGLIITGRGQPAFAAQAPQAPARSLAQERRERSAYYDALRAERERVRAAGRRLPELPTGAQRVEQEIKDAKGRVVYIARLSPDAATLEWALLMDEVTRAPSPYIDFHFDQAGWIVFPEHGVLRRLSPDGRRLETVSVAVPEPLDAWAASPSIDSMYLAGRGNSETGRGGESFASPYITATSLMGEPRWRAWGWSGHLAGLERYRLLGASRISAVYPKGNSVIVHATYESADSVLLRDPSDLDAPLTSDPPPLVASMFPWRGAPDANLFIELGARDKRVRCWTHFSAFFPDEARPWGHRARRASATRIASVNTLSDGSLVLTGYSETGLPLTQHAWARPSARQEYESAYVTILDGDWSVLRFSTYLPAIEEAHTVIASDRAILFGNAGERDALSGPPLKRPLQAAFGGAIDAWFALVDLGPLTRRAERGKP